jgi:sulfur-carrier protein
MSVRVKTAATLRRYIPGYENVRDLVMEIRAGTTVRDLVHQLGIPEKEVLLILVNDARACLDTALSGDECVALFPPVGEG